MSEAPRTLLKALVLQRHWSYRDFAKEFERMGRRLKENCISVSEAQFRRWTAGTLQQLPAAAACRVLQAMFDANAEELFQPPSPDASAPALNLEAEIDMTARDAQTEASAAASASISDTTVDQLRDDVRRLARHYHTKAPSDVLHSARSLRESIEQYRDRTQVPVQQQELLILAGQACAILATAAFDLGSFDNATSLARSAALYGETARFAPLQAFAAGTQAYIAYFSGRPAEAANCARRGAAFPGLGDVAQRRLAAIEARAYGHLGDTASAQRALMRSTETNTGATDDLHDGVGGEFGFSEERLAMSNGSTCILLGDGAKAEEAAQRALDLVSARPSAARSLAVIGSAAADLATGRLMRGDLNGAADSLNRVWDVPVNQRATGLLARSCQVRAALTASRYRGAPLASEIGEHLEDFNRVAHHQLSGATLTLPVLGS
ncbi:DNA-binding protein [Streptomyces sp. BE147]|uniref:DNA-binding protein n=1 Tax=Streptomyces sp. BE147 TaxID=3002524 RepID=UPI002E75DE07|nr:DNA-binding protein [Streptomyces sp. BE147]MEE1741170.1 DNA-binding protein [Streptomyces sp. BE147]